MTGRTRIPGSVSRRRRLGSLENVSTAADNEAGLQTGQALVWDGSTMWTPRPDLGTNKFLKTATITGQIIGTAASAAKLWGVTRSGTIPSLLDQDEVAELSHEASFPTDKDGRIIFHTGERAEFYGDETAGGWWGLGQYVWVEAAGVESVSSGVYLKIPMDVAARYSSTIGAEATWACRAVNFWSNIVASSTCTIELTAGGTGVSGVSISYSAETGGKSLDRDDLDTSGTVSASSVLGLRVSSGTLVSGYKIGVLLQRFET